MGFFSNVTRVIGDVFEEAGAAVGDVVVDTVDILDPLLGPRGQRGRTLGESFGAFLGKGNPAAIEIGGRIGGAISQDIAAAPDIYLEQQVQPTVLQERQPEFQVTDENFEAMLRNTDNPMTAGFDTGTVLDIRYPRTPQQTIGEAGVNILSDAYDYFFAEDDNQPSAMSSGMRMCPPSAPKAFNVNKQTGCVTITRKQQAKLKEAVRMFGGQQVARNLGISQQLLQQLLLKTFRARRRGISGADIRAVKRVDRQMHSLAMALGGISSTSKAVAARRSPSKR